MNIDMENINNAAGFYVVDSDVFTQTLGECDIRQSFDLGGGVVIHFGSRGNAPAWFLDNSRGELNAIWVEDAVGIH